MKIKETTPKSGRMGGADAAHGPIEAGKGRKKKKGPGVGVSP